MNEATKMYLEVAPGHGEDLGGQDDDTGGAVAHLLVLGAGDLDQGLAGRVLHLDIE